MDRITFKINGVENSVGSETSSDMMLVDYLRNYLDMRGTKYMCREAGCGACIVAAVKTPGAPTLAVSACMVPIMSCQDWEITTIEKVGNKKDGYHAVQKAIAKYNGTQCGYCTPGWVMAMYSLLQSKKQYTMREIEESFGSNICRCTGYRPILDALKTFGSDAPESVKITDIEDLHICERTGERCSKDNCLDSDWCFISDTENYTVKEITLKDGKKWFTVYTISDITKILQQEGYDSYVLLSGDTSRVPHPIVEKENVIIDITRVTALKGYRLDQNLIIGAGVTLTDLMDIFETVSTHPYFAYLKKFYEHFKLVAHIPVRNLGSLAGNLMIKNKYNEFPSDIFVLFETVGAQLTIQNSLGIQQTVTMQEFLSLDMTGNIMLNALLPPLTDSHEICTFKIMPRSQSVHAIVNAGFLYKLNKSDNIVEECRIVYGNLSPSFVRATNTEEYLLGKSLFTNETVQGALKILESELVVTESRPEPTAAFRKLLALRLFYKGLLILCPTSTLHTRYITGATRLHETRPVSTASQSYDTDESLYPLNEPLVKHDALVQCAGEALYTDDTPTKSKEVFAAFVLSTVSVGEIASIDPYDALQQDGVIAFYSAKDIPGKNSFTPNDAVLYTDDEELLCSGTVKHHGQPIGIIVAKTHLIANRVISLVKVTYKNVKTPVLDVKDAVNDSSRIKLYTSVDASETGSDVAKTISGTNTIYGQYHFTMETLVCVTTPTEEGLEVYTASQWINGVQLMISRALNIDESRVDVHVHRVGGAYGIKISRSNQVAVACSLVASKLNLPCRFIQTLGANTKAMGKRFPCHNAFEVSVNSSGVIQSANINLYLDNGHKVNEDIVGLGLDTVCNCYDDKRWSYKYYNAITDTAKNTWCRAPGTLENTAMAELLMERISYVMSLDPIKVRLANLDTTNYSEVEEILETLKTKSNYEERRTAVDTYNAANRWKKRGLRFSLLRWTPIAAGIFEVNLSVFHGDGTVAITHGGIEMGQGVNTKAIQICAYLLNISVDKIQVKTSSSYMAPNCFPSGGSITSESICIGVQKACKELLARLEPIKAEMTDPTWEELIIKAFSSNVDLHAHGMATANEFQTYNVCGATLAEVEIDVLTGEFEIIRVDLMEDVGLSISPEIDVGQVEGAFIMGLGYWTCEDLVYDTETGELLTDRAWNYHVPQALDIPQIFNVYFKSKSYNSNGAFGSKCVGEPPICMTVAVPLALREAISSARADVGIQTSEWFDIDGPFSVEHIGLATATELEELKLY